MKIVYFIISMMLWPNSIYLKSSNISTNDEFTKTTSITKKDFDKEMSKAQKYAKAKKYNEAGSVYSDLAYSIELKRDYLLAADLYSQAGDMYNQAKNFKASQESYNDAGNWYRNFANNHALDCDSANNAWFNAVYAFNHVSPMAVEQTLKMWQNFQNK